MKINPINLPPTEMLIQLGNVCVFRRAYRLNVITSFELVNGTTRAYQLAEVPVAVMHAIDEMLCDINLADLYNYGNTQQGKIIFSNRVFEKIYRLEDELEDSDASFDPDNRLTCHTCCAWATDQHLSSLIHRRRTWITVPVLSSSRRSN